MRQTNCPIVLAVALSTILLVPSLSAAVPQPARANVAYGPHERNVLDFFPARSNQPTPLVIFFHGGGFRAGDKGNARHQFGPLIEKLHASGISFAAVNYRFMEHAAMPQIMRDGARAVQFLRANAREFNIDPLRIAACGTSAGAGMSLWLGVHDDVADLKSNDPVLRQSSRIAAVGIVNGQATYDLTQWPRLIGPPPDKVSEVGKTVLGDLAKALFADVDMLAMITRDDAPVFLFCSHPDTPARDRGHYLHHPRHARLIETRCKELSIPVTWHQSNARISLHEAMGDFLIQELRK